MERRYTRKNTVRLAGHDYGAIGKYFVTICTKWRAPWFGSIHNGRMFLNAAGCIADQCWRDIPVHFPHVIPDAFVIMPDHVHGIITIGHDRDIGHVGACDSHAPTGTSHAPTGTSSHGGLIIIPRPPPGTLGSMVNQYKSVCTKRIRAAGYPDFQWQPRFHDHIIRHPDACDRIRRYIALNPVRWGQ